MPRVDIAATRAAASRLGDAAGGTRELMGLARVGAAAGGELSASLSQEVLHPLEAVLVLRLGQLGEELEAMARGMDDLADNTARATG
jgi:hypothetical protein